MPSDVSSVKRISNSKYTAIAILLIISIGVYLNTLPNEFVYDDEYQVLGNLWLRDVKYIPEIFLTNVWAFVGEERLSNYYRPLMHIIYMIDYHIFGLKPWGFHLTNIIFHAGVTLLVFMVLSILINQSRDLNFKSHPEQVGTNPKSKIQKSKSQFSKPESQILNLKSEILNPPFIAALLFAAHPIHTEAVTWVGGIPELSFTLFYLFSFYLYINSNKRYTPLNPLSRGENKNKRGGKRIILSALFFFLATLCKEPALTLPLLMLVYDYSISRSSVYSSRFTVHSIMKRYLPYLIVSIIYFVLRTYALGGFAPIPQKHAHLSNYEYFINIFPLFIKYLEKLILPVNMNAFYVFHPISSIFQWKGIIALVLTLVFIFLVYFFKKHKIVFLSLLWIVIPLLPVLYIPALGENTFADRYLYLPSIGFIVLAALAIERISHLKVLRQSRRFGIVIIPILIILTGLYSAGTIKRNYIWRDSYTLWTDTVEKSPDGHIPHGNLGNVYSEQQRFEDAIKEYMIAIKLKPDSPEAHNNLGFVYFAQQRLEDAIKEYMIAIKLKPDSPEAHNNLGLVYFAQQRFEDAIKEYMTALKLNPDYPEAYNNIGNVYYTQGRLDEAIEEYKIAVRLKPDSVHAHYNLGNIYYIQGRLDNAIEEYKIAVRLNPDDEKTHNNIGNVYYTQGRLDEAIEEYKIAVRLNPDDEKTHNNIGNVYAEQQRFEDAINEYRIALKLKPDYYEAHYDLGLVYLEKGLKLKAQEEFKTALKLRPDFSPAKKALESIKRER